MKQEEVFVFIDCFLGLFAILAIAIGVVVGALIGEGEVRLMDTPPLLKVTKVPLGTAKKSE
jgi:uncharacterized membrane protein (DUF441 family)